MRRSGFGLFLVAVVVAVVVWAADRALARLPDRLRAARDSDHRIRY